MTTEVRASHLLVQTEEEAKQLREEILNGKKFEDAAFSMNVGDLSEPIQTQFGWHLLYLTDKKD